MRKNLFRQPGPALKRYPAYITKLGTLEWNIVAAAVRHTLDILLITVPLFVMTYFLFNPAAFNAFTAWLARTL
jgi:hypothetical protein